MATLTPPVAADPTRGTLTVERYVAALYPRLAWEGTVRLGDAATAGRLVERVLYRAWNERDRFATTEALLKHAQESALGAIAREEERRLAVTRFDADETAAGMPGDLHLLSMDAVLGRLREGRRPTPSVPMPVVSAAAVAGGPPTESPRVATPVLPTPVLDAPAVAPANGKPRQSVAADAPSGAGRPTVARPKLRSAQYISATEGKPAAGSPNRRGIIAGAAVAVLAVVAIAKMATAPNALDRARAAAADSTLPRLSAERGQRRDTTLAPGFRVVIGPASSVAVGNLADGIRAARVSGTAWLEVAEDSASPLVVSASGQRLETMGGALAFVTTGDSMLVFAERGDVQHYTTERITRIPAGNAVVISASGEVTAADRDDATRAFAWRSGRLQTARGPVSGLRAPISQWFALELDAKGVSGDSVALDVPLDSLPVLIQSLATATGRSVTRAGDRLTIAEGARPVRPAPGRVRPARRDVATAPAEEPPMPVLRKLPGVP